MANFVVAYSLRVYIIWALVYAASNCPFCAKAHSTDGDLAHSVFSPEVNQIIHLTDDEPDRKSLPPLAQQHGDRTRLKREVNPAFYNRASALNHRQEGRRHHASLYQRQAAQRQLRERNDQMLQKLGNKLRPRSSRPYDSQAKERMQRRRERLRQLRRQRQRQMTKRPQPQNSKFSRSSAPAGYKEGGDRSRSESSVAEDERKLRAVLEMQREMEENRGRQYRSRFLHRAHQSRSISLAKDRSSTTVTAPVSRLDIDKTESTKAASSREDRPNSGRKQMIARGKLSAAYAPAFTTFALITSVSKEYPPSNRSTELVTKDDDKYSLIASSTDGRATVAEDEESGKGPQLSLGARVQTENDKFGTFDFYSKKGRETGVFISGRTTMNPFIKPTQALDYLSSYESRPVAKLRPLKMILPNDVTSTTTVRAPQVGSEKDSLSISISKEAPKFQLSLSEVSPPPQSVLPSRGRPKSGIWSDGHSDTSMYSKIAFHSQQLSRKKIVEPSESVKPTDKPQIPSKTNKPISLLTTTTARLWPVHSNGGSGARDNYLNPHSQANVQAGQHSSPKRKNNVPGQTLNKETDAILSRRQRLRRLLMMKRMKSQKQRLQEANEEQKESSSAIKAQYNKRLKTISSTVDPYSDPILTTRHQQLSTSRSPHWDATMAATSSSEDDFSHNAFKPVRTFVERENEDQTLISTPKDAIIDIESLTTGAITTEDNGDAGIEYQATFGSTSTPVDSNPLSSSDRYEDIVGSGEPGSESNIVEDSSEGELNSKPYFIPHQTSTRPSLVRQREHESQPSTGYTNKADRKPDQDYTNLDRRWSISQDAWDNRNVRVKSEKAKKDAEKRLSRAERRRRRRKGSKRRTGRKKKRVKTENADNSVSQKESTASSSSARKSGRKSAARRWRERMRKRSRKNGRKNRRNKSKRRRGSMAIALNSLSSTVSPRTLVGTKEPEAVKSPFIGYKTAYDFLSNQKGSRGQMATSESRRESHELNRYMGEGMCEIFQKHYVSTRIGGKCE